MYEEILKDEFGPEYVIDLYDPSTGMRGFLVIDNTLLGPGKGGIRMTPDVTLNEVFRLARTMTWKNSLAGIPFGGAKAGMVWDGGSREEKRKHVEAFARMLKMFAPKFYIAAPDVGSGEEEMKWFVAAAGNYKAATGKPSTLCVEKHGKKSCGIPHEVGSTGYGVAHSAQVAIEFNKLYIKNTTVAIHGFGNVGSFAFKFLTEMGARVVAVGDHKTGLFDKNGLSPQLFNLAKLHQHLASYKKAKYINPKDILELDVDVLIPASVTDVIHEKNKKNIKAKIIIEAGNIPMSEKIEDELYKKGILIVPDFVANSGGVLSSYAEYKGYGLEKMFDLVQRKIRKNTQEVLRHSKKSNISTREAGLKIARDRIKKKQLRAKS